MAAQPRPMVDVDLATSRPRYAIRVPHCAETGAMGPSREKTFAPSAPGAYFVAAGTSTLRPSPPAHRQASRGNPCLPERCPAAVAARAVHKKRPAGRVTGSPVFHSVARICRGTPAAGGSGRGRGGAGRCDAARQREEISPRRRPTGGASFQRSARRGARRTVRRAGQFSQVFSGFPRARAASRSSNSSRAKARDAVSKAPTRRSSRGGAPMNWRSAAFRLTSLA
jgi:hypothetical protein